MRTRHLEGEDRIGFRDLPKNTSPFVTDQSGYALVTVLAISIIIIVIVASITDSVKRKLGVAIEIKNRNAVFFKIHSAMNEALYAVLTAEIRPYGIMDEKADGSERFWNLYGKPIVLENGAVVTLQDTAGMVPLLFNEKLLRQFMRNFLKDSKKANRFVDTLLDWQDRDDLKHLNGAESFEYKADGYAYTPRNHYLQIQEEITLIKGFDKEMYAPMRGSITHWGTGHVNFLTMNRQILETLFVDPALVDRIVDLRDKKVLTRQIFIEMTGMADDASVSGMISSFYPSPLIMMDIHASHEKAADRVSILFEKKEDSETPFDILEWRR